MRNSAASSKHQTKLKTAAVLAMFFLAFSAQWTHAFDYNDVMQMFRQDSNRSDPLEMVERFTTVIQQVSNMEIKNKIDVNLQSRGLVRRKMFDQCLSREYENVENGVAGEEFLLKKLHLLAENENYLDIIYNASFAGVSGLYLPENKELLIMKGASRKSTTFTLLHELIHAAQDSYIDLDKEYTSSSGQDNLLASSSLIEGQAEMIQILISLEKMSGEKITDEVLKTIINRLDESLNGSDKDQEDPDLEPADISDRLQNFPYSYGLKFVLQLYTEDHEKNFVKMLSRRPLSTEQVMHFNKFKNNEKPKITILQNEGLPSTYEKEELYNTSLGEYFIKSLFDIVLTNDSELNNKASQGWGGDYIRVFRNRDRMFFVWDTLWDTQEDAQEFFDRYKTFSKKRFGTAKFTGFKSFDVAYPDKHPYFAATIKGNRVLIVEGDIDDAILDDIVSSLRL